MGREPPLESWRTTPPSSTAGRPWLPASSRSWRGSSSPGPHVRRAQSRTEPSAPPVTRRPSAQEARQRSWPVCPKRTDLTCEVTGSKIRTSGLLSSAKARWPSWSSMMRVTAMWALEVHSVMKSTSIGSSSSSLFGESAPSAGLKRQILIAPSWPAVATSQCFLSALLYFFFGFLFFPFFLQQQQQMRRRKPEMPPVLGCAASEIMVASVDIDSAELTCAELTPLCLRELRPSSEADGCSGSRGGLAAVETEASPSSRRGEGPLATILRGTPGMSSWGHSSSSMTSATRLLWSVMTWLMGPVCASRTWSGSCTSISGPAFQAERMPLPSAMSIQGEPSRSATDRML
mmetsp:Transcript_68464/g.200268  ORF Transcript_68464/g.200268 Transcript_68464/m.200268 type:complete len:346 (+) Transcript_68464:1389-2426(+)